MSAHDFALVARILRDAHPSTNGWVRANCGLCPMRVGKEDKQRSFAHNVHTGVWRCLRCGASGRISSIHSMVPSDVVAAAGAVDYDPNEATQPPEGFYRLDSEPALSAMVCRPAYDFLEARGITPGLTLLERVKKSKDLYRKPPIFPHTLVEIPEAGEGLMGCTICGGFEGTLLQNCLGVWCRDELDNVYFGRGGGELIQIEDHWHIMLNRALKKRDMDMHEAIRSVP